MTGGQASFRTVDIGKDWHLHQEFTKCRVRDKWRQTSVFQYRDGKKTIP